MSNTLRITRQQLAKFLGNDHDAIRQFENLFGSPSFTNLSVDDMEATRLNRITVNAPANGATLTLADGSTLETTGGFVLNLTVTAASTPTLPVGAGTLVYLGGTNTWSNVQTFAAGLNLAPIAALGSEGDCWLDSTQKAHGVFMNGIKQMLTGCIFTGTADGSNGAAKAETSILGTGVGTKTLPGGFFVPGKTIRIRGVGTFTTAASPGTATLRFKLGSLVVAASAAITPTASKTNAFFEFEFLLTCRTLTTVQGGGALYMDAAVNTIGAPSTATLTIDNATPYAVDVTSTNTVASGCIWTTKVVSIEVLN